ncbi:hypothetical protein [Azospirillum griseum]|uniref:Helix-turn-helix domain-containing protein n=1 Tax=Azospirillum griseum TaxID=2496639 RepID=A0A3S0KEL8_9PROT|nr:hypothetical protein [Azospirillum griseum]RTR24584.1 hypothetical protein EJ903_02175 [Azospirillum griseum]
MNAEGGYTRQYRRLWDNPVFRSKQEAAVFSWMLAAAQWRDGRISTKYGPVRLETGELLIAERSLAEEFGLHRNTMRNLIQRMVDDGMIALFRDRCPQNAGTIARIMNYKEYQGIDGDFGPQEDRLKTTSGTSSGPQEDRFRTKNKEGNTVKEVNCCVDGREPVSDLAGDPVPSGNPQPEPNGGLRVILAERAIIHAFDNARAAAFGEDQRRPFPHPTDITHAKRWVAAGADDALCEGVFSAICAAMAARSQAPPGTLSYFEKPIADAIAQRNRPMPKGGPHEHRRPVQPIRHASQGNHFEALLERDLERCFGDA